jgi:acyl-CoA synthetase (AMP-forming)/AMP-acid ligase II
MIEWWGPVIDEFYGASEGGGATYITSPEWMAHQGSVGRPLVGEPHVCDDAGNEMPIGEDGVIWFAGAGTIGFHNDPEQSRSVVNERGWVTFWDVGHVDGEGYLYLTDRKTFMIISGGVNIYPQEVEDALILHPKVVDCAVFGIPDPEFGEQVKAVVQLAPGIADDAAVEAELLAFCRSKLAGLKCPKSIDFEAELPRAENGKLYKRLLRDRYLGGGG